MSRVRRSVPREVNQAGGLGIITARLVFTRRSVIQTVRSLAFWCVYAVLELRK
jgi:hypothetical protein